MLVRKEHKMAERKSRICNYVVIANVIMFAGIYLAIEVLSKFDCITITSLRIVAMVYALALLCGLITTIVYVIRTKMFPDFSSGVQIKSILFVVFAVVICIMMGKMAYYTIPRNHDSMTYHLPRIMHWLQNRNLNYWYTSDVRELCSQPLAEMVGLLLYAIAGSDHLANMQQFYGYVFSIIISCLILQKYKVKKEFQFLAALLIMMTPIVISEGVTTQNDLFSAIFPLIYLYLALDTAQKEHLGTALKDFVSAAILGVTAGMAFLSKAQSIIPVSVISVWLLITRIRKKDKWGVIILYPVTVVLVALLLATPYFLRNYKLCGDILATVYFGQLSVSSYNPRGLFLNVIKNWSMGGKTYSNYNVNEKLYNSVLAIARWLKFDIDDARFALDGMSYDMYLSPGLASCDMDAATAPFISWFFLAILIVLVAFVVKNRKTIIFQHNLGLKLALVLSVIGPMAYIRWQPWVTRLLVPTYMLMAIFISIVVNDISLIVKEKSATAMANVVEYAVPIVLLYCAIPVYSFDALWSMWGQYVTHPYEVMLGTEEGRELYYNIADNAKDAKVIGLWLYYNTEEYPLWVGLKNNDNYIFHIDMNNQNVDKIPDKIVKVDVGVDSLGDFMNYANHRYECCYLASEDGENTIWELID